MKNPRVTDRFHAYHNVGFAILLALTIAGCNRSDDSRVRLTGKVTYQGKPLEYGTMNFVAPGLRQVTALIEDGEITDVTTKTRGDGISPGEYQISVVAYDRSQQGGPSMIAPSVIPEKFADMSTSGLTVTIQPKEAKDLQIDLK